MLQLHVDSWLLLGWPVPAFLAHARGVHTIDFSFPSPPLLDIQGGPGIRNSGRLVRGARCVGSQVLTRTTYPMPVHPGRCAVHSLINALVLNESSPPPLLPSRAGPRGRVPTTLQLLTSVETPSGRRGAPPQADEVKAHVSFPHAAQCAVSYSSRRVRPKGPCYSCNQSCEAEGNCLCTSCLFPSRMPFGRGRVPGTGKSLGSRLNHHAARVVYLHHQPYQFLSGGALIHPRPGTRTRKPERLVEASRGVILDLGILGRPKGTGRESDPTGTSHTAHVIGRVFPPFAPQVTAAGVGTSGSRGTRRDAERRRDAEIQRREDGLGKAAERGYLSGNHSDTVACCP